VAIIVVVMMVFMTVFVMVFVTVVILSMVVTLFLDLYCQIGYQKGKKRSDLVQNDLLIHIVLNDHHEAPNILPRARRPKMFALDLLDSLEVFDFTKNFRDRVFQKQWGGLEQHSRCVL